MWAVVSKSQNDTQASMTAPTGYVTHVKENVTRSRALGGDPECSVPAEGRGGAWYSAPWSWSAAPTTRARQGPRGARLSECWPTDFTS